MSRGRKRSLLDALSEESPDVVILAEGERIPAHSQILRFACSCAKGLPDHFTEWDLRDLMVDGRSVTKDIVLQWLEIIYWQGHLKFDPKHKPTTLKEVKPLMMFADAVGTSSDLLDRFLEQLPAWFLELPFSSPSPSPSYLKLQLTGSKIYRFRSPNETVLYEHAPQALAVKLADLGSKKDEVKAALAKELEELTFLANRLRMKRFARVIQSFLQDQLVAAAASLCHGLLPQILSTRVLHILDKELLVEAWVRQLMVAPSEDFSAKVDTEAFISVKSDRISSFLSAKPTDNIAGTISLQRGTITAMNNSSNNTTMFPMVVFATHTSLTKVEDIVHKVMEQYGEQ